jgi:biopolymer transport protein ExbD
MPDFKKKSATRKAEIPSSSLADIVFILLIFFMVSTTITSVKLKLRVRYPQAKNIEKIEQKNLLSYIYVGPKRIGPSQYGKTEIEIDNAIVSMDDISTIMQNKYDAQPRLIVSIRMDKNTHLGMLIDIQKQLQDAGALRINYSTKQKKLTSSP